MSKKNKKWEQEYEKFRKGEYDSRIEELKEKEENRTIRKDELSELKKLEAIKNNLSKVKNIKEFKELIEKNKKMLEGELKTIKKVFTLDKDIMKLEMEMKDLQEEYEKILDQLKNKDLPENERIELEAKKQENEAKRTINNKKFIKIREERGKILPEGARPIIPNGIEFRIASLETKISKCNMVCNNLMQGKSWDTIEVKLDNWDKSYKGDKNETNRILAGARNQSESTLMTKSEDKEIDTNYGELPVVKEEKPKWYQFIKRFKNFVQGIKRRNEKPELDKESDEKIMIDLEKTSEEIAQEVRDALKDKHQASLEKNDNDFKNYLREVAEKGMKSIVKEEKIASKERAKERLKAMKEQAQAPNRYKIDENGVKHDTFGKDKEDDGLEL